MEDLDIRKVDHVFVTDYEFYLRSVRKYSNNTAVKYIKNFGKIIRICLANGWLLSKPFRNYKAKLKKVERMFLSAGELQQLARLCRQLIDKRYQLIGVQAVQYVVYRRVNIGLIPVQVFPLPLSPLIGGERLMTMILQTHPSKRSRRTYTTRYCGTP